MNQCGYFGILCCVSIAAITAPSASSAQAVSAAPAIELKTSTATGLPLVYAYHGTLLNHDLKEIPPTEENIKNVLARYFEGIARQPKNSPSVIAALQSRVRERAKSTAMEMSLNMRIGALLVQNVEPSLQPPYRATLRIIEAWALSGRSSTSFDASKNDASVRSAAKALGLPVSLELKETQEASTNYIKQCQNQKVPIPPDWGSPAWEFQGVLAPKYTFSAGADGPTEVWAAAGTKAKGACMALPRKDLKTNDVVLLGIICQSKETGKACFWDNIDRKTNTRLTGDAVKKMKISAIQDGAMLAENCTNCHRGYNVFPIHPGTTLDIAHKFDIQPDKRYEPISGQQGWGNPSPVIQDGQPPCGSCHEIPAVGDDNNTNPTMPSAYCRTVLEKAANLTMPYVGTPVNWDSPKPAYESHIKLLKALCEAQNMPSTE